MPLGLSLLAFLLLSLEKAGRIKSMFFSFKKLSLPLVLEKEVAVSYLLMKRIYFTFCSIEECGHPVVIHSSTFTFCTYYLFIVHPNSNPLLLILLLAENNEKRVLARSEDINIIWRGI